MIVESGFSTTVLALSAHDDETTPCSRRSSTDWKVFRHVHGGTVEGYRLHADPLEKSDFSKENPKKTEFLVDRLDGCLLRVEAQFALPNPAFDPNKCSGGIRDFRAMQASRSQN